MKNIKNLLLIALAAFICIKACKVQDVSIADAVRQNSEERYRNLAWHDDNEPQWTLLADDATATVYNAVPEQCNTDVQHTASMYKLNLKDILSDKVIAMERTMMSEYGIKYGDKVLIEGAGRWDGVWQVQDTMNRRFAGKHKIDILVPNNIRRGKWKNVRIYIPANEAAHEYASSQI